MASLELIPVAFEESALLPAIRPTIAQITGFDTEIVHRRTSIYEFYRSERSQYDGGLILEKLEPKIDADKAIIYTTVDLFIPIFTFVFGLAKLNGKLAIVSTHRLNPVFYGLPPDKDRLQQRLIKETIHELGHLLNLRHCADYRCVMASSNTADELDVKGEAYCDNCQAAIQFDGEADKRISEQI
jgi:archaemetzincin